MAARGADEENAAVVARGQDVRAERRAERAVVVGRVLRESMVRVRGVAMVVDEEVCGDGCREDDDLIEASGCVH